MSLLLPGLSALMLLVASLPALQAAPPTFLPVRETPRVEASEVNEASGLASSPTHPGWIWTLNDSGGKPFLHLLDANGGNRGKLRIHGAENFDWEDLASFSRNGKSYLLIADTGDNTTQRDFCTLFIVREPALPSSDQRLDAQATPSWQIRFRYENGPRDCEAVAVDATRGIILLITKRTQPPEIHQLPLTPSKNPSILTTRRVGNLLLNAPITSLIPFASQPTGLDLSPDGSLAAVVTYHSVFIYPRTHGQDWATAFSKQPVTLKRHRLAQAESVAFSSDGNEILTLSEGKRSRIVRYRRAR
jgi:hypothetical protein